MSTEREQVEALAIELREREMARQRAKDPHGIQTSDTPRTIARDVIVSDWLAEVKAAARAEGYGIERLDALKIRIRAEERERIARDIRAQIEVLGEGNFQEGWLVGMDLAACIAQGTQ